MRNGEFCRLPQQLLLDDVQDCDQGEDLCYDWPEQSRDGLVRIANRFFFYYSSTVLHGHDILYRNSQATERNLMPKIFSFY